MIEIIKAQLVAKRDSEIPVTQTFVVEKFKPIHRTKLGEIFEKIVASKKYDLQDDHKKRIQLNISYENQEKLKSELFKEENRKRWSFEYFQNIKPKDISKDLGDLKIGADRVVAVDDPTWAKMNNFGNEQKFWTKEFKKVITDKTGKEVKVGYNEEKKNEKLYFDYIEFLDYYGNNPDERKKDGESGKYIFVDDKYSFFKEFEGIYKDHTKYPMDRKPYLLLKQLHVIYRWWMIKDGKKPDPKTDLDGFYTFLSD